MYCLYIYNELVCVCVYIYLFIIIYLLHSFITINYSKSAGSQLWLLLFWGKSTSYIFSKWFTSCRRRGNLRAADRRKKTPMKAVRITNKHCWCLFSRVGSLNFRAVVMTHVTWQYQHGGCSTSEFHSYYPHSYYIERTFLTVGKYVQIQM